VKGRPVQRKESERGFALLLVFLMSASIALMLYLQLPRVAFESERQKEQLLIDRGEQYKRAVQLFRVANNRFPTTLEELEKYQDKRYLRHRYKDPMTGKDEWRLVHTNGMFLTDSQVTKPPTDPNNPNNQNPLPGGLPNGVNAAFPGAPNPGQAQVAGQDQQGPQEQNAAVAQRPSDRTMPGQTAGAGNPGFGDPNQQAGFQPQAGFPPGFSPAQIPGGQPGVQPAVPGGVQAGLPPGAPQGFQPGQLPQPGLQQPVFPQTGQVANGQQPVGDPQQQQQIQNQGFPQQNFAPQPQNDPNNNFNNPANFPPITLYPAGGNQPGAANNNQQNNNSQQFNPQFPGQLPGQQPQFPGQQPIQPSFNGVLGQPGVNPGNNQQQTPNPQYRVDPTGALVPINPQANSPQGGFPPINLPAQQPGAAPGAQPNNPAFRVGGGASQPNTQVRTPTVPGPPQQQGQTAQPNQALNLINQLLTTPRQPPAGVTSGQGLGTMQTNGIAGVASTAKGPSIKRYKERSKYNEWEFVFEVQQQGANGRPGGQQGPLPGGLPGAPGTNTTPTSPGTLGQPNNSPSFVPQGASPSILPQR
jgi:hypothetical protein